jgi:hypothetical protein
MFVPPLFVFARLGACSTKAGFYFLPPRAVQNECTAPAPTNSDNEIAPERHRFVNAVETRFGKMLPTYPIEMGSDAEIANSDNVVLGIAANAIGVIKGHRLLYPSPASVHAKDATP